MYRFEHKLSLTKTHLEGKHREGGPCISLIDTNELTICRSQRKGYQTAVSYDYIQCVITIKLYMKKTFRTFERQYKKITSDQMSQEEVFRCSELIELILICNHG